MGSHDRRARHKASLRREILDAANDVFVREGFDRLTLRMIARRIEYSPTTIYLHFKDKRDLLRAMCDEAFSRLAEQLSRVVRTPGVPLASLREMLGIYAEFGLSHPNHYAVAFLIPPGAGDAEATVPAAVGAALDVLRREVAACVEQRALRIADPELATETLWAGMHGMTALLIARQGMALRPQRALIDAMVGTLITGLEAPSRVVPAPAASPLRPEPSARPAPASRPVPRRDFSFMD